MFDLLNNLLKDQKGNIVFNCFGIWHILFMILIFGSIIITLLILKNKDFNIRNKVIINVINITFTLYILDFFLMPLSYKEIDIEKLPFHICTVSCVLCFLSRYNKFFSRFKIQFALLGLIGNIIYVIYPAGVGWYQITPYSYRVIQTLLYHGLMTLYGVLVLAFDDHNISWKSIYKDFIVIIVIIFWALLGNTIYNNEYRLYNWLFLVQDPFYILPKNIAPFLMPFIIFIVLSLMDVIIYFTYFTIRKKIKK